MPDDVARQLVVDALDDLGEHDHLSSAQRTSRDTPYPPSFVEERLEELQQNQWWTKALLFGGVVGGVLLLSVGVGLGWSRIGVAGALPALLIPQITTVQNLIWNCNAERLHSILHQMENPPRTAPGSPTAEAV